ncbi:hypothetical protein CYK37_15190 [Mesorhizobium loti]|nr:phage tail tip lysozyme [Mesorhizobium loti]PLP58257.1 hypothetical protein CYK37_15190 [Mesorhizobium loti]
MTRSFFGKGQQGPNATGRDLLYRLLSADANAPEAQGPGSARVAGAGQATRINPVAEALGIASAPVALPEAAPTPTARPTPIPRLDEWAGPRRRALPSRFDFARNDKVENIRQGLIDRRMPSQAADAFMMNIQSENDTFNPGRNEDKPVVHGSRGGFGLLQWTGRRRRDLEKFAADRGVVASDLDTQLDFLASELNAPGYSRTYEKILAAPDTGRAAAVVVDKFLNPAAEHKALRMQQYLDSREMIPQTNLPQSAPIPIPADRSPLATPQSAQPDPARFEGGPVAPFEPGLPMLQKALQNPLTETQRAQILREIERQQSNLGVPR